MSINQMASHGGVHPWNPKPTSQASVLEMLGDRTRPLATFSVAPAAETAPNLKTV